MDADGAGLMLALRHTFDADGPSALRVWELERAAADALRERDAQKGADS